MLCAKIVDSVVAEVTVTNTAEFGATWLMSAVGGDWVDVAEGLEVAPGYTFEEKTGRFVPPKYFPSWVLNEQTMKWEPPIPQPEGDYLWDEGSVSWVLYQG